jgi:uncharacterized protein with ATP-grasp and redox domains
VRQAADAVRLSVSSEEEQDRLMHNVLQWIGDIDLRQTPPAAAQMLHRRLRALLAVEDPYRTSKNRHNALAARLIPSIRRRIAAAVDPLTMAVRYAITGNIIDLGAKNNVGMGEVYAELQSAPMQPVFGDLEAFKKAAGRARTILYLADNAGEIFFDRLLIEQFSGARVTLVVRGAPVINDATLPDAQAAGLEDIAEVMDNGSDAPGTLLHDCSPEFRRRFDEADMIIAKGQGNFESLSEGRREVFFLFRAKCPVISRHSGFTAGTYVATNRFERRKAAEERGG